MSGDMEWLDEILVILAGRANLNGLEEKTLREFMESEYLDEAKAAILKEIDRIKLDAKIEENDYHWHHQKHIERRAATSRVSGYFLDRKAELERLRAGLEDEDA
jgi:hypothetical protein